MIIWSMDLSFLYGFKVPWLGIGWNWTIVVRKPFLKQLGNLMNSFCLRELYHYLIWYFKTKLRSMKRIKSKQVYEKFYIINHMDTKIKHPVLFSLIFVKRTVFKIAILWCKKKLKNSKIRFKKLVLSWQTFQKLFDCINNIVSNGRSY